MKLEDQVISLELAKCLKKLGLNQQSHFIWWYTEAMSTDVKYFPEQDWDKREWSLQVRDKYYANHAHNGYEGRALPAYTVAELGELIGPYFQINSGRSGRPAQMVWTEVMPNILIRSNPELHPPEETKRAPVMPAKSEAEARAKVLFYLIENKIITIPNNGPN